MTNKVPLYKIILSIFYVLIYPALILFISGDYFWIEGWIFSVWFISTVLTNLFYLYFKDPDLLAERFKLSGGNTQQGWDRYFLYLLTVSYLAWFTIMPLDAKRFHWTVNFPLWLKIFGGICLLISSFLVLRAFADNTFSSALVRIQRERNQHVVSTGVYAIIRHPMYLGAILMFISLPLLLGSKYGILLGIMLSFLFILRIFGEEKMLENELEGYKDYEQKVKYRLIPFVW